MSTRNIIIIALAILFMIPVAAKAEYPVYFADANLKAAVVEELQEVDPTITDPTPSNMLLLTTLDAHKQGIVDLTGIEYATNLTFLRVCENNISDLSPLSGLTNLRNLKASSNQISDLTPLSGLTNLDHLELQGNQISDLTPLSGLTNLDLLQLKSNQISDLGPLSGLTNLTTLINLSNNPISDLNPISGLINLTCIKLEDIQTTNIYPLAGLANLDHLYLSQNKIVDISPLSTLTKLQALNLYGNKIVDISPLSTLTKLQDLCLNGNKISDISFLSGLTNLHYLALERNKISDVSPLSELTNLEQLRLTRNPLNWDSYFVYIPMIIDNNPGIVIYYDPWADKDNDGISDFVEKGAPNGGDGNQDGTPDCEQPNVASLRNAVDATYVTLESPAGTDLVRVTATKNPSSDPLPEGVEFPIGFFEFTLKGIAPGAAITITLFTSTEVGTYYKYGPTPSNPTDHWYEFLYDGTTGAKILADKVILHFVDGQRGDKDLKANGQIVEPGGPGLLLNQPPVADAGDDQTVEQVSYAGTEVTLDGSGSTDPDSTPSTNDDIIYFDWWEGDNLLWSGEIIYHVFPLGTHVVTLYVKDRAGATHSDEVVITVVDTTQPTISSISASPEVLWPPNHKMVEVAVEVDAEDNCDPEPVSWILGVDSNEPINGPGDGNTELDWDYTDDPLVVLLRAERAGGGSGRVYTVHVVCVDASGNETTASCDVIVPHDQGKGKK